MARKPVTDRSLTASSPADGVDLGRLPRRHLIIAASLPLVLLGLIAGFLLWRQPSPGPTTIGSAAPEFTLVDLDGSPVRLSDLRGHPVVVNFWASWCGPCVEEFPLLRQAVERHAADGLVVIGIVYQDRSEAARAFMQRNGATWQAAMDPGGRVAEAYRILGPPETFFIDAGGIIRARHIGQFTESSLADGLAAIMDRQ